MATSHIKPLHLEPNVIYLQQYWINKYSPLEWIPGKASCLLLESLLLLQEVMSLKMKWFFRPSSVYQDTSAPTPRQICSPGERASSHNGLLCILCPAEEQTQDVRMKWCADVDDVVTGLTYGWQEGSDRRWGGKGGNKNPRKEATRHLGMKLFEWEF